MEYKKRDLTINFLLCIFGLFFWHHFYSYLPSLLHADWFKENVYLDVLRDAIVLKRIPYEYFISIKPDYTRFFAIPEICLLPDIFLLPFVTNNQFFFIHTAIFFLIGNFGIFLYAKNWSINTTLVIFILFNFNGFILSHLAEGHFQFLGYFTFPIYFKLATNCITSEIKNQKLFYSLLIGLLIGFNFLNGSTHTAIWMCILTALLMPFAGINNLLFLLASLFTSALVGGMRLIPSSLYFGHISGFITGYPSLRIFIDSFISSHDPYSAIQINADLVVGWWEFDFFLGWIGTFLVATLAIKGVFSKSPLLPKALLAACSILIIFSLGNNYEFITQLPISVAKVERISSRFIALPMVGLLLLLGDQLSSSKYISKLLPILFIASAIELFKNASHYFLGSEISDRQTASILYIDPALINPSYVSAVRLGILVSTFSIFFILLVITIWTYRQDDCCRLIDNKTQ